MSVHLAFVNKEADPALVVAGVDAATKIEVDVAVVEEGELKGMNEIAVVMVVATTTASAGVNRSTDTMIMSIIMTTITTTSIRATTPQRRGERNSVDKF